MKVLWAPWRMDYILSQGKDEGCVFCQGLKESEDEKNLIVWRGEKAVVFMNRYPYNNGHLLIMPHRHIGELEALDSEEVADIHRLICLSLRALNNAFSPDGFNIGLNLGKTAGAGVLDHIHWHIVPRWEGDTNFMPVLAETKVMPEHLNSTYQKLRRAFLEESQK